MSITVGTNSWVTLAEANSFLGERYGASVWASLSDSDKESLLITAFWKIYGSKSFSVSQSSTDEKVKAAQIITALYIYENNSAIKKRLALQAQGVKSFSISKFSETLSEGSWLSMEAKDLLDEYSTFEMFATIERELD